MLHPCISACISICLNHGKCSHSSHSHDALKFQNCLLLDRCWTGSPWCWYPNNRKQPPGKILVPTAWSLLQHTYCPPLHKSPFLSWPSVCRGDPCPAASITSQLTSALFSVMLRATREDINLESFSQSAFLTVVFIKQIISCTVFFSNHSFLPTSLSLYTSSTPTCLTASSDYRRPVKWERQAGTSQMKER